MGKVQRMYSLLALIGTLTVLSAWALATPPKASAAVMSWCDKCHEGETELGNMAHAFGSLFWYSGQNMDCAAFNSCHGNSQPGRCSDYHYSCLSASLQLRMEEALAHNDRETVRRLLRENPKLVEVDGGYMRFRDCQAEIVAVVPVAAQIS